MAILSDLSANEIVKNAVDGSRPRKMSWRDILEYVDPESQGLCESHEKDWNEQIEYRDDVMMAAHFGCTPHEHRFNGMKNGLWNSRGRLGQVRNVDSTCCLHLQSRQYCLGLLGDVGDMSHRCGWPRFLVKGTMLAANSNAAVRRELVVI